MRQESEPQCKVCFSLRTFVLYLIKIRSNSVNVTVSPSRSRRNWELIGYLVGRRVRWAPIGTTALVLCFVLMTGTREKSCSTFLTVSTRTRWYPSLLRPPRHTWPAARESPRCSSCGPKNPSDTVSSSQTGLQWLKDSRIRLASGHIWDPLPRCSSINCRW